MYKKILVCLDNSPLSTSGIDFALEAARITGASVTGLHVYAARLHGVRFRQMEGVLPPHLQGEAELRRQRAFHEDLISRGLRTISDSYMEALNEKARGYGITPDCVHREGKNFEEIVREASRGYDLVVLGAHGLGKSAFAGVGSVCERVARRVETDVIVVREGPTGGSRILVGIDGSPSSFGALSAAINLSRVFNAGIEAVSVYDPNFHTAAFHSLKNVLTEEAGRIFRFREQEKLHSEIIDNGLRKLYSGYLERAAEEARLKGVSIKSTLLSGKPCDEVIKYAASTRPLFLVMGKRGMHATETLDIGSTVENSLRYGASNIYITSREAEPTERLAWDGEALRQLHKIPPLARGLVKALAEEEAERAGEKEVTPSVLKRVRERFE